MRHSFGMEATPGQRLQTARRLAGIKTQAELGALIGVSEKQIRNYEGDKSPIPGHRMVALRKVLPALADEGDPVESAIRRSELAEWRQTAVISVYQRNLDEQRREATA